MNRSDRRIVSIQEFKSRPGDAGAAVGCLVWNDSKTPGGCVVHSFIHSGGPDPELQRFWGHYGLALKPALAMMYTKAASMVEQGYEPYRFDEDCWYAEQARQLVERYENRVDPQQLDEVVYQLCSASAPTHNNDGLPGQVEFLIRELGTRDAEDQLKNAVQESEDDCS